MGVLQFDGTDDRLRWTSLGSGLLNVSDGAWTCAVLCRRNSTGAYDAMTYLLSSTGSGVAEAGISFVPGSNSNKIRVDVSGTVETSTGFSSITNTYMFVMSKGAGTVAPRLAAKEEPGGTWAHYDCGATLADQVDATMLDIGVWQGTSDPFDGWIGLVAWWEGAMSDANKEALDNNWRTSDWWTSAHGQPVFLAELNVAASSVVDLAGNATSASHVGTTLDSGETLDSWTFDGTGGTNITGVVAAATASGPQPMVSTLTRPYVLGTVS